MDLIETYKFINNKYKTPPQLLFSVPNRRLRGHSWWQDFQTICKNWHSETCFYSSSRGTMEFIIFGNCWFWYCGLLWKIDASHAIWQRRLIDQVTKFTLMLCVYRVWLKIVPTPKMQLFSNDCTFKVEFYLVMQLRLLHNSADFTAMTYCYSV